MFSQKRINIRGDDALINVMQGGTPFIMYMYVSNQLRQWGTPL